MTGTEVSRDGKFLYASSPSVATISVFARNSRTGLRRHLQELKSLEDLFGTTAVRLSPDGQRAVATAMNANSAVLYRRNHDGTLAPLFVARDGTDSVRGLQSPFDVAFSPDSRFVYIACARSSELSTGGVAAFEITERDTLRFVGTDTGRGRCFRNACAIAVHPDGRLVLVASSGAGMLTVLDRDDNSGKTEVRQVLKNNRQIRGLDGVMGLAISEDGRFVYTSAGRFRGNSAIGVYQFNSEYLTFVQELTNGEGELHGFRGGNEITVSADGASVYAVASGSGAIACFHRNQQTGRLRFLESVSNQTESLIGAAGVELSPDGRFVYVAAEGRDCISAYRCAAEDSTYAFIDLQDHANQKLNESFHGSTNNPGLSGLAPGRRRYGGVIFDVGERCLQLAREASPSGSWGGTHPQFEGILVGQKVDELHMLHAVGWADRAEDGTVVAQVVLHYEDGGSVELPIAVGTHARDWWDQGKTPCTEAVVAWVGDNPKTPNVTLRLFRTTLTNPQPHLKVARIDYVSAMTSVAPFCVAITAEARR